MKVLGVDPGLRISGYAVLEQTDGKLAVLDAGVFKSDSELPLARRLEQMYTDIESVIGEQRPDMVAVEELYAHYKHPRTAILMGHVRGVFLLAAARHKITVHGFSATRVKKSLTGNGHAAKGQIQRAITIQMQLAEVPKPADVADAMAIAACCINEQSRETLLTHE